MLKLAILPGVDRGAGVAMVFGFGGGSAESPVRVVLPFFCGETGEKHVKPPSRSVDRVDTIS